MKTTILFIAVLLSAPVSAATELDKVDPSVFFHSQKDGLAAVITEINALNELVEIVSQLPAERGEYVVNFTRIKADIRMIRNGVIEAIDQPGSAPRSYPAVNGDYLE